MDVGYLLQQRTSHWRKCERLSWSRGQRLLIGRFVWNRCLNSCLTLLSNFLLLCCFLACFWGVGFFIMGYGFTGRARPFSTSSPSGWKKTPLWRRCVVWFYVRCVPPVCWYIMPPQVVMIAVSGALGQCPTPPWWPPCCAMPAWPCSVVAGTKHWPKPKSWWRHTSPATFRTLRSWLPCKWLLVFLYPTLSTSWILLRWPCLSSPSIKYFQYVIYGLASFFFLYGILLLAEGFYATSAVKQTFGEFRSTQCGRCLSLTVRTWKKRAGVEGARHHINIGQSSADFALAAGFEQECSCFENFLEKIVKYGRQSICWHHIYHNENVNSSIALLWFNILMIKCVFPFLVLFCFVCFFSPQQFIIVTYILALIWLAVFAFTAVPVLFLFNMEQTCHTINILAETTPSINQHGWICMDARQYGALFL